MSLIKTASFHVAIYSKGNPNSSKFALIIPGKLDTKNYANMVSHVNYMANKGYFALSFDPPGTWESQGDIKIYTMTNYLKAINEIISHYGNKPTVIIGHSRGGRMAELAGAINPHVEGFVSIMGTLRQENINIKKDEWEEKYAVSLRDLPPGGGEKIKKHVLPYSFYEDEINYQLTDEIKHSKKPKLFFLGKRDTILNPQIIRDAYKLFSQPKELYELDSGHDYRLDLKIVDEVNNVIGNFLERYNLL